MEAATDISGPYYRQILRHELAQRCLKNPRYSLRAFAKALAIDPAALSRVLAGKRALSVSKAVELAEKLRCAAPVKLMFVDSVLKDLRARDLDRHAPEFVDDDVDVQDLNEDMFTAIADWHHYAILELTFTEGFQSEPAWIAAQLGLDETTVSEAVDRLLRLGLLLQEDGKLRKAERALHARSKTLTTPALRSHHKQLLKKAEESVDEVPADQRAITTIMLPTDPAMIDGARKMIEDFAWQLCNSMTRGRMTDVYALTINLFPLKGEKR